MGKGFDTIYIEITVILNEINNKMGKIMPIYLIPLISQ